ncbi:hypothetical protein [Pseudomonas fluorescens]|nr:hypothetical protein [Pseudomonas fluorescens]
METDNADGVTGLDAEPQRLFLLGGHEDTSARTAAPEAELAFHHPADYF